MKKLVMASVLALGLVLVGQQRASAWHDFKFSAGVSISWCGGGNSYCKGRIQGADWPGTDGGLPGYSGYYADGAAPSTWQAPAPTPAAESKPAAGSSPQTYNPYYNSGYQPVGYYYTTGYQPVGYTYPGYYQAPVPAYWYGR
jgi:hypothetical protein